MSHQEPSLNSSTKLGILPIDPNKETTTIGATCQRYYEPPEDRKRTGAFIPLQVSVEQSNTNYVLESRDKEVLYLESLMHNWELDPLGLCITEPNGQEAKAEVIEVEEKVQDEDEISLYELEGSSELANESIHDDKALVDEIIFQEVDLNKSDNTTTENVMDGSITETEPKYMDVSSEALERVDGFPAMDPPPFLFPLPSLEKRDDILWNLDTPLSQWPYFDDTDSKERENKENEVNNTSSFHTSSDSHDVICDTSSDPTNILQDIKDDPENQISNLDDGLVSIDLAAQQALPTEVDLSEPENQTSPLVESVDIEEIVPQPSPKSSPALPEEEGTHSPIMKEASVDLDEQKLNDNLLQHILGPAHSTDFPFHQLSEKHMGYRPSFSEKEDKCSMFSSIFGTKNSDIFFGDDLEKNLDEVIAEKNRFWNERRLFLAGFLCPLLWFYGGQSKNVVSRKWQQRCRLAAYYFLGVVAIVMLVMIVKMADSQVQPDQAVVAK